tara:strand:+ start:51 stop:770 length:720 start_codon:yes stop_codon:yes gene_type:complete
MSLVGREFNADRPFGPYIVRSTISDELHKILLDTAYKIKKDSTLRKKNDYRKSLAGNLKEEYSYSGAFTKEQDRIVEEELVWLASIYTKFSKQNIGVDMSREPHQLTLHKPVWVNFMKQGEWNPSHSHTGDISCVMYLKVPKEIRDENKNSETSNRSNTPSAGKIEFCYGESIGYDRTGLIRDPIEKEIFLFPAKLKHMVYPFKSKSERISVSVNFGDSVQAARNLHNKNSLNILREKK